MDGFDNYYSDSDDGKTNLDDGEVKQICWAARNAAPNLMLVSRVRLDWKKLCSRCRIAIDNLLDNDGNEVLERRILVRVNMRRQLSL